MRKLWKDNKGFSLGELLIVIAILGILTGLSSYGIGLISTKPATTCAKNIEVSLQRCRTTTMGKKCGRISFFSGPNGIYMLEEYDYAVGSDPSLDATTAEHIGASDVSVSFGSSGSTLTSAGVTVVFNRSDGSVSSGGEYFPIVVSKAGRTYTIDVNLITGAVSFQ